MLVLLVEVAGTEFPELGVPGEDMEHREQDLVRDGHCCTFGAQARLEAVVLLLVVGAFDLGGAGCGAKQRRLEITIALARARLARPAGALMIAGAHAGDRKSTRLNSSHSSISYAVFCLKKKKKSNCNSP